MKHPLERANLQYSAPKVLEHSEVRFETMISAPMCTPGFVKIDNKYVRVDCIEDYL